MEFVSPTKNKLWGEGFVFSYGKQTLRGGTGGVRGVCCSYEKQTLGGGVCFAGQKTNFGRASLFKSRKTNFADRSLFVSTTPGGGGRRGVSFSYEKQTLGGGVCFAGQKQTSAGRVCLNPEKQTLLTEVCLFQRPLGEGGVGGFVSPTKNKLWREGFVLPTENKL